MKLWGGRFQKETDQLVNELNASISFDQRLYREDITGSMAHAQMLSDCGIISREDAAAIIGGLPGTPADIGAGGGGRRGAWPWAPGGGGTGEGVPWPATYSLRTVWPGALGAIMNTSTLAGGVICLKWMLKPCANASALPSVR